MPCSNAVNNLTDVMLDKYNPISLAMITLRPTRLVTIASYVQHDSCFDGVTLKVFLFLIAPIRRGTRDLMAERAIATRCDHDVSEIALRVNEINKRCVSERCG